MGDTAEIASEGLPAAGEGLEGRRVELLYDQSAWSLPGGLLAVLLLAVVLWEQAPRAGLIAWVGLNVLLTAGRLALVWRYHRSPDRLSRPGPWRSRFLVGAALSGSLWGGGALVVAPIDSLLYLGAYILWLGGLLAGGVATLSPVMRAYLAFALPAVLPLAGVLLLAGNPVTRTVGAVMLVFLGFILISAWRTHRAILATLRLQFENQLLNSQLRADLARHIRIEAQLREAKRRSEVLAKQLRQLSTVDGLTGIANRRHFDQAFQREWRRAMRGRYPLSLALFDLDFFKYFNDRYGHRAGDDCLRQVAQVLRAHCRRSGDLAARYGGEELAVILPGTGLQDAREIAERAVRGVEALRIPHEDSSVSRVVTISAGVGTLVPDRNMSPKHLIELADAALYRAKGEGRNRVCTAPDVLADVLART